MTLPPTASYAPVVVYPKRPSTPLFVNLAVQICTALYTSVVILYRKLETIQGCMIVLMNLRPVARRRWG